MIPNIIYKASREIKGTILASIWHADMFSQFEHLDMCLDNVNILF